MPEFKNKLLGNKNSTKWLLLVNYKKNINFLVKFRDDNFILFEYSFFLSATCQHSLKLSL